MALCVKHRNCRLEKGIHCCANWETISYPFKRWYLWLREMSISKKHFRQRGMGPAEWTHSVRAVRETPVRDHYAPSVKTTHRVTYRPPIAVSRFLLALWVTYFKQTLWRCGQLWPYVGMGSLGTCFHWDCNEMGDAVKISHRVPSTLSSRSVGRREDMILPGREDPRNLGHREWDQQLGMIECGLTLYDERKWEWDVFYLLRGLPNIYSPSLCPPLSPMYLHTTGVASWRCTQSSMSGIHLQTEIAWTQRCTWRPRSSGLGDALGGHDHANL